MYIGKEDNFQKALARYLDSIGVLWAHIPNGGSRNVIEATKLKAMGTKKGVPDILIFEPKGIYNGMAIELKVGKNKISEYQKYWLEELMSRGWRCIVTYDLDEAIEEINNYLNK
jgi:hypothetical protein